LDKRSRDFQRLSNAIKGALRFKRPSGIELVCGCTQTDRWQDCSISSLRTSSSTSCASPLSHDTLTSHVKHTPFFPSYLIRSAIRRSEIAIDASLGALEPRYFRDGRINKVKCILISLLEMKESPYNLANKHQNSASVKMTAAILNVQQILSLPKLKPTLSSHIKSRPVVCLDPCSVCLRCRNLPRYLVLGTKIETFPVSNQIPNPVERRFVFPK
jgi:hypothetical protein